MMVGFETLLVGGAFFEDPRWRDGRWWVSDFYREVVLAVDPDGHAEEIVHVAGRPSGLGWMPDGSLLVVSMTDRRVLRHRPDGTLTEHADIGHLCGWYANDMVVDGHGRAYVGNFGFDLYGGADPAPADLVRVDPDGTASAAAQGLAFPNGSVITPDGATLIVGETAAARYTAWTIGEDGSLSDRRVWGQIAPEPQPGTLEQVLGQLRYAPDGCALDAEGHIWSADALGGRCCRIAPGGAIVGELRAPEGMGIFACMLGGEDGRTLLACCAPSFAEHERIDTRDAILVTTRVDVPHAGLP